ncbi:MAG: hypothetical protein Q8L68_07740 [Methylococcales bacterium]|nr:hypothetical protein [Methylococcales bacterium]
MRYLFFIIFLFLFKIKIAFSNEIFPLTQFCNSSFGTSSPTEECKRLYPTVSSYSSDYYTTSQGNLAFNCYRGSGSGVGSVIGYGRSCPNKYFDDECSPPNSWNEDFSVCYKPLECADGTLKPYPETCPTCTAPQVLDPLTNICIIPRKRDCVIPENPASADCIYPNQKNDPKDCSSGYYSFPLVGELCPSDVWDSFLINPGETKTCSNGSPVTYPTTCFDAWSKRTVEDLLSNPFAIGAVALAIKKNPIPLLTYMATNNGFNLPKVMASFPLAVKTAENSVAYTSVNMELPTITLGKALQEYIKAAPYSEYANNLITKLPQIGNSHADLFIHPNDGTVVITTDNNNQMSLTPNQIAAVSNSLQIIDQPVLDAISKYLDVSTIPWYNAAAEAIDVDFQRVYNPAGQSEPLNFPKAKTSPLFSTLQAALDANNPLEGFDVTSPQTYTRPTPTNTTLPDPTSNPNATGTDAVTSPITNPEPGTTTTPNDPTAIEALPNVPDVYPDTWKYFNFLKMANPFTFSIADYLPQLPETSCTYEIHKTFNVPFLGVKHFDLAPCVPLQPLRDVLAWAFGVLSLYICFTIIFSTRF